jgi:hypothetical protein
MGQENMALPGTFGPRFVSYAARVRALYINSEFNYQAKHGVYVPCKVDDSVINALAYCSTQFDLFPNLYELIIWNLPRLNSDIRILPSSKFDSLTGLVIATPCLTEASAPLLSDLMSKCKNVKEIVLDGENYYFGRGFDQNTAFFHHMKTDWVNQVHTIPAGSFSIRYAQLLGNSIHQMKELKELKTSFLLPKSVLRHLAKMTSLTNLRVQLEEDDFSDFPQGSFPVLQELELCHCTENLHPFTTFLGSISSAFLQTIEYAFVSPPTAAQIKQLLCHISEHISRDSITQIHVRGHSALDVWLPLDGKLENVLEPLWGMRRLRRLSLGHVKSIVADQTFLLILESLPALMELWLATPPVLSLPTLYSANGRLQFAETRMPLFCLRVEDALLHADTAKLGPIFPKLEVLQIDNVVGVDTKSLASTLAALFPGLVKVAVLPPLLPGTDTRPTDNALKRINAHVNMIRRIEG